MGNCNAKTVVKAKWTVLLKRKNDKDELKTDGRLATVEVWRENGGGSVSLRKLFFKRARAYARTGPQARARYYHRTEVRTNISISFCTLRKVGPIFPITVNRETFPLAKLREAIALRVLTALLSSLRCLSCVEPWLYPLNYTNSHKPSPHCATSL